MARIRGNRGPVEPVPKKVVKAAQKKIQTAIQKESKTILELNETILDAVVKLKAVKQRVLDADPERNAFCTSSMSKDEQYFSIPFTSAINLDHMVHWMTESSKAIKEMK
jgi:hypothetical protein